MYTILAILLTKHATWFKDILVGGMVVWYAGVEGYDPTHLEECSTIDRFNLLHIYTRREYNKPKFTFHAKFIAKIHFNRVLKWAFYHFSIIKREIKTAFLLGFYFLKPS